MAEPFLAEIRIVGFNFAPRGWAFCDGQTLPINQNQSLFSLLGTTFGGDGRTSFALPDLRSRSPIHVGSSNGTSHGWGEKSGTETEAISIAQMPAHDHSVNASPDAGDTPVPIGNVPGVTAATDPVYEGGTNVEDMNAGAVIAAGGGQGHDNMMPYLALRFCIALQGLFPSRN